MELLYPFSYKDASAHSRRRAHGYVYRVGTCSFHGA